LRNIVAAFALLGMLSGCANLSPESDALALFAPDRQNATASSSPPSLQPSGGIELTLVPAEQTSSAAEIEAQLGAATAISARATTVSAQEQATSNARTMLQALDAASTQMVLDNQATQQALHAQATQAVIDTTATSQALTFYSEATRQALAFESQRLISRRQQLISLLSAAGALVLSIALIFISWRVIPIFINAINAFGERWDPNPPLTAKAEIELIQSNQVQSWLEEARQQLLSEGEE
jgi:hypothetical protein